MSANSDDDNALLPDLVDEPSRSRGRRGRRPWVSCRSITRSRVVGTIEVHAEGPELHLRARMAAHARRLPAVAADAAVAAPRAAAPVPAVGGEPAARGDAAEGHRPAARRRARGRHRHSRASSAATPPARCRSASPARRAPPDWRPIPSDKALERILEELPTKPFLVGEDGVSMSLAGVQTKLGVAIDAKGRICVPINGAPSTWILKPEFGAPLRRRAERGAVPGAGHAASASTRPRSRRARRASAPI